MNTLIYINSKNFLLALILFASYSIGAQPVNNRLQDIVVQSPNATSLGRYGDVPVSYSTGVPSIGVPIHTVQMGSLSLPISLSYHSGGIRPAEMSSWVGGGWSLQAGGIISRQVQGIEDESDGGFLSVNQRLKITDEDVEVAGGGTKIFQCIDLDGDRRAPTHMMRGQLDGEPDIFSFSVGSYNGKFYFDSQDSIVLVPQQDIKIYYRTTGSSYGPRRLRQFTIVTPDGTQYIYGSNGDGEDAIEISRNQTVDQINNFWTANSWYLKEIRSFDGLYYIKLNYTAERYAYHTVPALGGAGSFTLPGVVGTLNRQQVEGYRLANITTSLEEVIFEATQFREDIPQYDQHNPETASRLTGIKIKSGNSMYCKEFKLTQSYWSDESDRRFNWPESKRLRLDEVQEFSCAGENSLIRIPPHKFTYLSKEGSNYLPHRFTRGVDHWGFYNGKEEYNDKQRYNIPASYVSYRRYPGAEKLSHFSGSTANRETDQEAMRLGVISRIKYPTGGAVKFKFEANDYFDPYGVNSFLELFELQSESCYGSNPRTSDDIVVREFSKLQFRWEKTPYENYYPQAPACYARPNTWISLYKNGNFIAKKSYRRGVDDNRDGYASIDNIFNAVDYPDLYGIQPETEYKFVLEATGLVAKFSVVEDKIIGQYESRQVGGLRVSEIRASEDGGKVDQSDDIVKTYEYVEATGGFQSSGQLINVPTYVNLFSFYTSPCSNIDVNGRTLKTKHTFWGGSSLPLTSFEGRHIYYSRVIERLGTQGTNVYEYDKEIEAGQTDPNLHRNYVNTLFPNLPSQPKINAGKLLRQVAFNTDEQVVQEITNDPLKESYSIPRFGELQKEDQYVKAIFFSENGPVRSGNYSIYNIRTKPYRLAKVTRMVDGVSGSTEYGYESSSHLAPTIEISSNSDGTIHTTNHKYSFDEAGATYQEMKARNILTPIRTTLYVADTPISGQATEWLTFDRSTPYPAIFRTYESVQRENGTWSGFWEDDLVISAYQWGKPKIVSVSGWEDQVYVWDNNGLLQSKSFIDHVQEYRYYKGSRLLRQMIDVDGLRTDYTYDALSRLKSTTAPKGITTQHYKYVYKGDDTSRDGNYIRTIQKFSSHQDRSVTSDDLTTYQYQDGLGRPLQTVRQKVVQKENGAWVDQVVGATLYDNRGRPFKNYETFASPNSTGEPVSVNGQAYTKNTYFEDPLSRIKTTTPASWHATSYTYGHNNSDEVKFSDLPGSFYKVKSLAKTMVIDPDGKSAITYTDLRGRTILERRKGADGVVIADTYNKYDNLDRIQRVYPPDSSPNTPELFYEYRYNATGNVIYKKVPDRPAEKYYYDERELLTYVTGASMPSTTPFLATYYDAYGRARRSGFVGSVAANNRVTATTIPEANILTKISYGSENGPRFLRDKVTLQRTAVLDGKMPSGIYLSTVPTYDNLGSVRMEEGNHLLMTDNPKAHVSKFKYTSLNQIHKLDHQLTTPWDVQRTVATTHYDAAGRVERETHKYDKGAEIGRPTALAFTRYTPKDQVKQLGLGGSERFAKQVIDYKYLENGFLAAINDPANPGKDYFQAEYYYDDVPNNMKFPGLKNGNIAGMRTRTSTGQDYLQSFSYDGLDRLQVSSYVQKNGQARNRYSSSYAYDKRGNLIRLVRNGRGISGTYGAIDQLIYNYPATDETATNRIESIADIAKNRHFRKAGLPALTSGKYAYGYDGNGNVTRDPFRQYSVA